MRWRCSCSSYASAAIRQSSPVSVLPRLRGLRIVSATGSARSENRVTAGLATGLFSTAVAVCILLIAAHGRPFTGQVSVGPAVLLQVHPESPRREDRTIASHGRSAETRRLELLRQAVLGSLRQQQSRDRRHRSGPFCPSRLTGR